MIGKYLTSASSARREEEKVGDDDSQVAKNHLRTLLDSEQGGTIVDWDEDWDIDEDVFH